MLASRITDAKSTSGDDIKNEKVTPIGRPALVKPINKGIEEQEQKKGLLYRVKRLKYWRSLPYTVPISFLVLSGGKKL